MSELHICYSRKDGEARRVMFCPTCKRRRRFYGWFQEWYGWTITCCHCGDKWADGERLERPFVRREKSAKPARRAWRALGQRTVWHRQPGTTR